MYSTILCILYVVIFRIIVIIIHNNHHHMIIIIKRFIRTVPQTQQLIFPELGNIPVTQLQWQPQFIEVGDMIKVALRFVLVNSDDAQALKVIATRRFAQYYLVPNVPARFQLEVHIDFHRFTVNFRSRVWWFRTFTDGWTDADGCVGRRIGYSIYTNKPCRFQTRHWKCQGSHDRWSAEFKYFEINFTCRWIETVMGLVVHVYCEIMNKRLFLYKICVTELTIYYRNLERNFEVWSILGSLIVFIYILHRY